MTLKEGAWPLQACLTACIVPQDTESLPCKILGNQLFHPNLPVQTICRFAGNLLEEVYGLTLTLLNHIGAVVRSNTLSHPGVIESSVQISQDELCPNASQTLGNDK